jgi:hypothetical protein
VAACSVSPHEPAASELNLIHAEFEGSRGSIEALINALEYIDLKGPDDWIDAQLRSYGCATERLRYEFPLPQAPLRAYNEYAGKLQETRPFLVKVPLGAAQIRGDRARQASTTTRMRSSIVGFVR